MVSQVVEDHGVGRVESVGLGKKLNSFLDLRAVKFAQYHTIHGISENEISPDKNFAKLQLYCIGGIIIHQCSKGCHALYAIINTGQKLSVIKFRQYRASGKNFLPVKISMYCIAGNIGGN